MYACMHVCMYVYVYVYVFLHVKAYGGKWYLWYSRQRYHKKSKVIPTKHRKYKLITSTAVGSYTINPLLYTEADNTRKYL